MRALAIAGIVASLPVAGTAQDRRPCEAPAASMSAATFADCAREGTRKYRDRTIAIADGYRLIGRDFPAMGEHWIRVSLLFDGEFHASRPEVLNYVVIDGKPELVGVGYAVALLAGEHVPDGPAGPHAWHDHSRTIYEETVLPHHHTASHEDRGPRLAMLHAWVWSPNPDGVFAADNWSIPFLRVGQQPPANAPRAAAKALSLATGGRDYFELSIEAAGAVTADERGSVKRAMDIAQTSVASTLASVRNEELDNHVLGRFVAIWADMWTAIERAIDPAVRQRISELPIR